MSTPCKSMKRVMTDRDMRDMLAWMVADRKSAKAVAEELAISPQYLSDILAARRDVSAKVAERLGYQRLVSYIWEGMK